MQRMSCNIFNINILNSIIKDIDLIVYELDYLNHLEIDFLNEFPFSRSGNATFSSTLKSSKSWLF